MNSPEVTAAKMICKSLDALTREVWMLRKDILEGKKLNDEMKGLEMEDEQIPPPGNRTGYSGSTGRG